MRQQEALSAASRSSYRKCISAILYRPQTREAAAKMRAEIRTAKLLGVAEPARELEAIATATPSSIGKPELRAFYNYAKSVHGHHMALAMIATLSAAFTWGQESILWRLGPNPREGMEFDHPDGRIVLVAMPEFSAWVAAADAIERASIDQKAEGRQALETARALMRETGAMLFETFINATNVDHCNTPSPRDRSSRLRAPIRVRPSRVAPL